LEDQLERFMGDSSFGTGCVSYRQLAGGRKCGWCRGAYPAVNIFDSPENAVVVAGSGLDLIEKVYDH
jgi:hypothetical protein